VYIAGAVWYSSLMTKKDYDHHFLGDEEGQYGTLTWRGRDYYDDLRWNSGYEHKAAFEEARRCYGTKR